MENNMVTNKKCVPLLAISVGRCEESIAQDLKKHV